MKRNITFSYLLISPVMSKTYCHIRTDLMLIKFADFDLTLCRRAPEHYLIGMRENMIGMRKNMMAAKTVIASL